MLELEAKKDKRGRRLKPGKIFEKGKYIVKKDVDFSTMSRAEQHTFFERCRQDPKFWMVNVLGVTKTWEMQDQILDDFTKNQRFTVSSGHALGKDWLGALLSLYFLYNFPPAIVIATAPSDRQVDKVIWKEMSKLYHNAVIPLEGKLMSRELKLDDENFMIGFTTKETNDMTGKFQGFHGANIFIMITEAQAVEDTIFEQVESLLVTDNSKIYLAGNPLRGDGAFYKSFEDPDYKKYKFSCYDAPNVKQGREVIPGMVTKQWCERAEKRWGKDSPQYQTRVLGEFPKQSVYSLISLAALRKCTTIPDDQVSKGYTVLSTDVARYGDDECTFSMFKGGKQVILEAHSGKATTETTGRAISLIKRFNPDYYVVDEGAMGAGVVDQVEEQLPALNALGIKTQLYPFNFGGKSGNANFLNKGTEAWFDVCAAIEHGKLKLMDDDDNFSQLSSRHYEFHSTGKMTLEPKEKLKKRGLPSPDRADATIMAAYMALDGDFRTREQLTDEELDDADDPEDTMEMDPITGYRRMF